MGKNIIFDPKATWLGFKISVVALVFSLTFPAFHPKDVALHVEILAQTDRDDLWTMVYDYNQLPVGQAENTRAFSVEVNKSELYSGVRFPVPSDLPTGSLKRIRLYPGGKDATISIRSISLESFASRYRWEASRLRPLMNLSNARAVPLLDESELRLRITGSDPPSSLMLEDELQSRIDHVQNALGVRILPIVTSIIGSLLLFIMLSSVSPSNAGGCFSRLKEGVRRIRKTPLPSLVLVAFFCLAVASTLIVMMAKSRHEIVAGENRPRTVKPELDLLDWPHFVRGFEDYFRDQLWFRSRLVRANNLLEIKLFRVSPLPKVIVGQDRWLFYKSELAGDGNTIEDYEGRIAFKPAELETIRRNIAYKTEWCKRRGIVFLIVIVPNKETVYSEYLPPLIRKGSKTRREQLAEYLKASRFPVLDLTDSLLMRKPDGDLYNRGGTHWNQYGAYYGYRSVIERLSLDVPGLHPLSLDAFDVVEDRRSSRDHWFGFKENREVLLTIKETYRSGERKTWTALAFRDSFFKDFPHFYQYHFRPYIEHPNRAFDHAMIERIKPDIVIWEIIERSSDILLYLR